MFKFMNSPFAAEILWAGATTLLGAGGVVIVPQPAPVDAVAEARIQHLRLLLSRRA